MAGTPIIATITGGLQDQMRFTDNGELYRNSVKQPSKEDGIFTEYGPWVYPIVPQLSIQGSPPTPYIYDSRPSIKDIASGIQY
jgi:hypothetical protein